MNLHSVYLLQLPIRFMLNNGNAYLESMITRTPLYIIFSFMLIFGYACKPRGTTQTPSEKMANIKSMLERVMLPEGFEIDVYSSDVPNARSLCLSPSGTLFIGTRSNGAVYALRDEDGDGVAEKKFILLEDGNMPNGVAYKDGDLYIAEVNRILRIKDIENNLEPNPKIVEIIYDDYPTRSHHGWKYIAFGPDGLLYIPVGAPCNICESRDEVFASITRLNVTTGKVEIYAKGVRNTVGFDWHPETDQLYFTDNGGDWLGDDMPACELNFAPIQGMHFGYPYCHQGDYPDPKLGFKYPCSDFEPPFQKLGPHVAPLGMEFVGQTNLDPHYEGKILIAEHGSWNRSEPIGYRITVVDPQLTPSEDAYTVFAEGWLWEQESWGRPVDLEWMPDGSLLVSDDKAGAIYRIRQISE